MPYKIIKRSCKKSDGSSGQYAKVKIIGKDQKQKSCHSKKSLAIASTRASHINASDVIEDNELIINEYIRLFLSVI